MTPPLHGLHHLKLPVSDLDVSLEWYCRVLGARHVDHFDHLDGDGVRFAVILAIPGVETMIELRWAPAAAAAIVDYDPITFVAGDLGAWIAHLDEQRVAHSPVEHGGAGDLVVVRDPDGLLLRLLAPAEKIVTGVLEPQGPWINAAVMDHPRAAH